MLQVCVTARRQGVARALVARCEALVRADVQAQRSAARATAAAVAAAAATTAPPTALSPSALLTARCAKPPAWHPPAPPQAPPAAIACELWLKADRANLAAMQLYKSMGYRVAKEYEDSDRLLLVRNLDDDDERGAFEGGSRRACGSFGDVPASERATAPEPFGFVVS